MRAVASGRQSWIKPVIGRRTRSHRPAAVALAWRRTRDELARELAELRATGRVPRSLHARLGSGDGLSLLSAEEYDWVHATVSRSFSDE